LVEQQGQSRLPVPILFALYCPLLYLGKMGNESIIKKAITLLNHKCAGSRTSPWLLCKYNGKYSIKRTITPEGKSSTKRTFQHLPLNLYRDIRDNQEKLDQLIRRLNHSPSKEQEGAQVAYQIKCAFISEEILKAFRRKLEIEIPSEEAVQHVYYYIYHNFLLFFDRLSPDPLEWYEKHQEAWGKYLLEKDYSVGVLKKNVSSANRFMRFLHEKRPKEVPLLVFKPISKAMYKQIAAEKELLGKGRESRKFIPEKDYLVILNRLDQRPELQTIFQLAYHYGLRRSEILGLKDGFDRIKKGYLFIDRQWKKITKGQLETRPTKGRSTRKVNHWFSTPAQCYDWVSKIPLYTKYRVTKDFDKISSELFNKKQISHKYVLHDCRHTWISRAVQVQNIHDVSLAAGHSDISVTNDYLKDARNLDDETWKP
jgi:integrase